MPAFEYEKPLKHLMILGVAFFLVPMLQLLNVIPKLPAILFSMAVLLMLAYTAWTLLRTAVFHLFYTIKNKHKKSKQPSEDAAISDTQSDKKSWANYDDDDYETDRHYFEDEEGTHS